MEIDMNFYLENQYNHSNTWLLLFLCLKKNFRKVILYDYHYTLNVIISINKKFKPYTLLPYAENGQVS